MKVRGLLKVIVGRVAPRGKSPGLPRLYSHRGAARGQNPLNKPSGPDQVPLPQAGFRCRQERKTPDAA